MKDSTEIATTCPYCREVHPLATTIKPFESDDTPNNGDFSICFNCGGVSIFDRKSSGNLRRPTNREARLIAHDDDLQAALTAWRTVMR